jgi:hypothetical protein
MAERDPRKGPLVCPHCRQPFELNPRLTSIFEPGKSEEAGDDPKMFLMIAGCANVDCMAVINVQYVPPELFLMEKKQNKTPSGIHLA